MEKDREGKGLADYCVLSATRLGWKYRVSVKVRVREGDKEGRRGWGGRRGRGGRGGRGVYTPVSCPAPREEAGQW